MTSLLDVAREVLLPPEVAAPPKPRRPVVGEILTPEVVAPTKIALGTLATTLGSVDITNTLPRLVTKHWSLVGIYLPLEFRSSLDAEGPGTAPVRPKHPTLVQDQVQQPRVEKETEAQQIARQNEEVKIEEGNHEKLVTYEAELVNYEKLLGAYEKDYARWLEENQAKLAVTTTWTVKIRRGASVIWQAGGIEAFDFINNAGESAGRTFDLTVSEDFVNPIDIGPNDRLTLQIELMAATTVSEGKAGGLAEQLKIVETATLGALKEGVMRYAIPTEGR